MMLPDSQMNDMGVQAFTDMKQKQPIDRDPRDNAYVDCVAKAITDVLPLQTNWEVVVFKTDDVNAFALPGGKIGVLSGILNVAKTPGQLAAVLGHETGHVIARHGDERASQELVEQGGIQLLGSILANPDSKAYPIVMAGLGVGAQYGVVLPFSRTQESEADAIGLENMARAGFNPQEAIDLWHNMDAMAGKQPPQWLSDHPSNANRINALTQRLPAAMALYQQSGRRPNCHR